MDDIREAEPNSDQREYFDEKLRILAPVLTPAELQGFRLRNSPRAQWLRGDVQFFNCSPDEFKALLDLEEKQLADKPDHLGVSGEQAIENVRTLFGAERAREYERVADMGYQNGRRCAERLGIEGVMADNAGQIIYEARQATLQVVRDTQIPVEQRRSQVQDVQAQAESRILAIFGEQAGAPVRATLRFTLANATAFIR
jgi:hypothetical protein